MNNEHPTSEPTNITPNIVNFLTSESPLSYSTLDNNERVMVILPVSWTSSDPTINVVNLKEDSTTQFQNNFDKLLEQNPEISTLISTNVEYRTESSYSVKTSRTNSEKTNESEDVSSKDPIKASSSPDLLNEEDFLPKPVTENPIFESTSTMMAYETVTSIKVDRSEEEIISFSHDSVEPRVLQNSLTTPSIQVTDITDRSADTTITKNIDQVNIESITTQSTPISEVETTEAPNKSFEETTIKISLEQDSNYSNAVEASTLGIAPIFETTTSTTEDKISTSIGTTVPTPISSTISTTTIIVTETTTTTVSSTTTTTTVSSTTPTTTSTTTTTATSTATPTTTTSTTTTSIPDVVTDTTSTVTPIVVEVITETSTTRRPRFISRRDRIRKKLQAQIKGEDPQLSLISLINANSKRTFPSKSPLKKSLFDKSSSLTFSS
ncbi:unnamed protein product [Lepeophtheirus salmonis]|uniref:(salmon louse) hypothetical protein n=1 Tax=Lepeophtheirus salmonis TaxID=72036 RepID=A0A7R8D7G2_LEPSM|nr:unnamed protein product [Lepeophtheirus salmonis]CAF2999870.1 unnamed protein product [Lepeophtheirus salmonis]